MRPSAPRVLIADDQADVLEALRLLLKAEGFQLETASSPAGVLAAVEAREFDVALIDLELHAGHDVGRRRPQPALANAGTRPDAAGGRHDRMGQCRDRRRSDAPGRARFHPEALGQRAAAVDHPDADRAEPGAAQRTTARGRELAAAQRRLSQDRRRIAVDAERAAGHLARGAVGCQRPRARRERHRQGRRRAGAPFRVEPGVEAHGRRQFRRRVGRRLRERALRPRARRLHRCQGRPRRPLRARRSGDALPRRDRQRAAQPAEQAAAGHRDRRVRAPRILAHAARRRADHLGDQRQHPRRSGRGAFPPGSAFPAEHDRDPPAAAARQTRRHAAARPALPAGSTRSAIASG